MAARWFPRLLFMLTYGLTIFVGAFLSFQIQPLIGKYVLPWFGGGPGVWTACMLFFQVALLAGYAYAHLIVRVLKPRQQVVVHLLLLCSAVTVLPVTPSDSWKPQAAGVPTFEIFKLLGACVGLPCMVLTSSGPLLQHWLTLTRPGLSPYRLYALSNVGSLLALVSYPFVVETCLTRKQQTGLWTGGFVVCAFCCGVCMVQLWASRSRCPDSDSTSRAAEATDPAPSYWQRTLWLLLPACGSVLLLAVTNKICADVFVAPLLWVLPLVLYLASFIVCFDNARWYQREGFVLALAVALAAIGLALSQGSELSLRRQLAVYCGGLFVCCMVCHGELFRLRPAPRHLTAYYLMIALGGALGGVFVAIVAPLIFKGYYELHWGLLLSAALVTIICFREKETQNPRAWRFMFLGLVLLLFVGLDACVGRLVHDRIPSELVKAMLRLAVWLPGIIAVIFLFARKRLQAFQGWRGLTCSALTLATLVLAVVLWMQVRSQNLNEQVIARWRNFYGSLTVGEYHRDDPDANYFLLRHGRVAHGLQFTAPSRARTPTAYYGERSGVGRAIHSLSAGARRIGMVGLGVGAIAAYARPGDYLRIYELNPTVIAVAASDRFTFLKNCAAKVEFVTGDARLSLERETSQQFDLLALDAFSGDCIPVHLLTREAFAVYERHLKTNGVIAVHISNEYLNFQPVLANVAREFGYRCVVISHDGDQWQKAVDRWDYFSTWALLTRNETMLKSPEISRVAVAPDTNSVNIPLWTDDFASVFQILR